MKTSTAARYQVSDELWGHIAAVLPPPKNMSPKGGRPRRPDRDCFDAILFVLRTGCAWEALDATGLCPSATAHDRFQEWVEADVFYELWRRGLFEYQALKGIDWRWVSADGSLHKAPRGGKGCGPNPCDRRKLGAKTRLVVDGQGVIIGVATTGANRPDAEILEATLESSPIDWPTPPPDLYLDKGYRDRALRARLNRRGHRVFLPGHGEPKRRWAVERSHSWMNRFHRVLIRWERKAQNYLALLHCAAALIAFQQVEVFG